MEVIANLGLGFAVALTLKNVAYCFIGVLLGTVIGVLPGIGPVTTVAVLLPISFTLQPESALILLAGIYYGAQYGGSTTAILVNIPGEASSVVTTIDGHQMARNGRAGPALGIIAAGIVVFGLLLQPLGLVLALLAVIAITAFAGRESRPLEIAARAVVLTAFSVGIFVVALRLPLPIWPAFL